MSQDPIKPERITKPMQLLGAWLVGLLTVDVSFLTAAAQMGSASWHSGALVIAAILNVPVFIGALFLLQTKFRPELQEDSYYATYLSSKSNEPIKITKFEAQFAELEARIETSVQKRLAVPVGDAETSLSTLTYGLNVNLPDKDKIATALSAVGVLGFSEFGQQSTRPSLRKVAISESVPRSQVNQILAMSRDLGSAHYGFIDGIEDISEDVLFGAYREYKAMKVAPKTT